MDRTARLAGVGSDRREPAKYPAGDEPEHYIEKRKHDPGLADQMGRIWELVIEATVDDPRDRDLVRSAPTSSVTCSRPNRRPSG